VQVPETHVCFVPQTVPQLPQSLSSVLVSTQTPLQLVVVPGHAQAPETHTSAPRQTSAQKPQLSLSV
jgi:hypothetical protein